MVLDSSWSNDDNYVASGEWMRLSKRISKKLHKTWPIKGIPTEEDIEKWIVDWYKKEFGKAPPMWLTGGKV